jgi:lipopolysaccharide/colanic/teichoic acid biosynthesis glycosyltransferase
MGRGRQGWIRRPVAGAPARPLGAGVGDAGQARHDTDELEGRQRALSRQDVIERAFDIVVGSLLLVVALPVILLTAVGSAIALRAWPFFVQDRIGRDGKVFRFVKVRTLPPTTAAYADKYELAEVTIPRFTRILRALHLDELPQLALVVAGRMSLVGPRPEMPALTAALPRHFATSRSLVRPGCTGLWQVGVHCDGLISEAPEYDSLYIQHHSVRLDVWIMAQTALKVVRGGQARITLADVPAWACPRDAGVTAPTISPRDHVVIDLAAELAVELAVDVARPAPQAMFDLEA